MQVKAMIRQLLTEADSTPKRLITRRSRVQIPPPPPIEPQVRGPERRARGLAASPFHRIVPPASQKPVSGTLRAGGMRTRREARCRGTHRPG